MPDTTHDLRDLQLAELEILNDVVELCREHSIDVFLLGGTLLGAVRHKGFIPWDDDIDVGMLRADYDRFVGLAAQGALGDRYFCQSVHTEPLYYLPFAKVRKNGTRFVEANTRQLDTHKGVFIDILPLDNAPDSRFARLIQCGLVYVLTRCVHASTGVGAAAADSALQRLVYRAAAMLIRPVGTRRLLLGLERAMSLYVGRTVKEISSMAGVADYWTAMLPASAFATPACVEFEGHSFSAPNPPDYHLARLYGDFMTPPPEDQRGTTHQVVEVSL